MTSFPICPCKKSLNDDWRRPCTELAGNGLEMDNGLFSGTADEMQDGHICDELE